MHSQENYCHVNSIPSKLKQLFATATKSKKTTCFDAYMKDYFQLKKKIVYVWGPGMHSREVACHAHSIPSKLKQLFAKKKRSKKTTYFDI